MSMLNLEAYTPEQQEATIEQLRIGRAQRWLRSYAIKTSRGVWQPAQFHEALCNRLQQIERGDLDRLIVNMPPRHGKSMLISETFPSWFLGRNPDKRVICTAYDQALAERFGRFNRLKLDEYGPQLWGVSVSKSKASQTDWGIQAHAGGMRSVAIGAGITGHGADLLIIDDPHKSAAEADSDTYRERIWQEWQQTLSTRLHAGGRVVVVATRWHEDDLCARLLASEPERWTVLSLPCEAEPDDPLGRPVGAALWPEGGYDEAWIASQKATVGSRAWAALYQQRPAAAEGNLIKREWVQRYKEPPEKFTRVVQSWDLTFSAGADNDYVVGQVWGMTASGFYLLDQHRRQMSFSDTLAAIRSMTGKWPLATAKLIEEKANGAAVLDVLRREVVGLIPIKPKTGKTERLQAVQPLYEAGNVYIPLGPIWADEFIDELVTFPAGAHDDQVDASTQALTWLQAHRGTGRAGVVI
mgnify:CR=1 FL=1